VDVIGREIEKENETAEKEIEAERGNAVAIVDAIVRKTRAGE
jgi:hypothetical protein